MKRIVAFAIWVFLAAAAIVGVVTAAHLLIDLTSSEAPGATHGP